MKSTASTATAITLFLGVTLGLIFKSRPWLMLRIPFLGLYLWVFSGYNVPPLHDPGAFDTCVSQEAEQCHWLTPGSVVVAAAGKCGTNWLMTIVHELRILNSTGDFDDFDDITDVVPWFEHSHFPGETLTERVNLYGNQWNDTRYAARVFKSHGVPRIDVATKAKNKLPVLERPDIKFIPVVRHPDDVLVSMKHFFNAFSDVYLDAMGEFGNIFLNAPIETIAGVISDEEDGLIAYLHDWWKVRHLENVLLLHYADIFANPRENIEKIAKFIGIPGEKLTTEVLDTLEYRSSIKFMKPRGDKYLYRLGFNRELRALNPGGLVRKGGSNAHEAKTDIPTEVISKIKNQARNTLPTEAFNFLYEIK